MSARHQTRRNICYERFVTAVYVRVSAGTDYSDSHPNLGIVEVIAGASGSVSWTNGRLNQILSCLNAQMVLAGFIDLSLNAALLLSPSDQPTVHPVLFADRVKMVRPIHPSSTNHIPRSEPVRPGQDGFPKTTRRRTNFEPSRFFSSLIGKPRQAPINQAGS